MTHVALSDKRRKQFLFRERANRGYGDKAGAATDRFFVWNEGWQVREKSGVHAIDVQDSRIGLALRLTPLKAPVLHGQNGFSQKGPALGQASYYYSLTRLSTEGELTLRGEKQRVTGLSWMDHEFGSNQLGDEQVGWDWFSVQLKDRTEVVLYLIRREDGSLEPYSSGTFVRQDGTALHLPLSEFDVEVLSRWRSHRSGATYPMGWRIQIPSLQLTLRLTPSFPDQELETERSTRVTYWEGTVEAQGIRGTAKIVGAGYVEMTGYAGRMRL